MLPDGFTNKRLQVLSLLKPGCQTDGIIAVTLYYGKANCYRTASAGTLEIDVTPYYSLAGDYTYENRPRVNINGELVDKAVSATVLWRQTNSSSSGDVLSAVPALEELL